MLIVQKCMSGVQTMGRRFLVPAFLMTFVILVAVPALVQVQAIEACTIIDKKVVGYDEPNFVTSE
jgi:hypothetical protein